MHPLSSLASFQVVDVRCHPVYKPGSFSQGFIDSNAALTFPPFELYSTANMKTSAILVALAASMSASAYTITFKNQCNYGE